MNSKFNFLPTTQYEAEKMGYSELDVIIVSSDAYVDHPAFAAAIIGRYLQSLGLRVGIIPQPDWHSINDFTKLGQPRLFFGVTAGNLDSMVSLYTAQRKIRTYDPYSENSISGKRPYLPSIVYTNRIKQAYKNIPVILGGIEASLRRIAHYDFYTDKIKPSILLDAKADLLVYGNGEAPLKEIINFIRNGKNINEIKDIKGTVVPVKQNDKIDYENIKRLPSYEKVKKNKLDFCEMTKIISENMNPYNASKLFQETDTRGILINPPSLPLSQKELDCLYELPFTRLPHTKYKGEIPAFSVVDKSITSHRGCYGGCSFCSLYLHQGKIIQSRSFASIKKEISNLTKSSSKKIVITDIGGPTANMYATYCKKEELLKICKRRSCIYPDICINLCCSSKKYMELLESIRKDKLIKAVYINSGIRYDIALLEPDFIEQIALYYTPGQLSVAPEHCSDSILKVMNKPDIQIYERFSKIFYEKSGRTGKKQYLLPYFMIGHPGANEKTEKALKLYLLNNNIKVEQIQEFYPTPMSISTAIYYTGMNPFTKEKIDVEKKLGIKKSWKKNIINFKC
ncbi:MAG: YgiQ family radical SAM protein [Candidatus Firestonebacteria bacterium]|nr:YgiQ family radical SAM protein [Candidatus Firestonebacteria bacterium]